MAWTLNRLFARSEPGLRSGRVRLVVPATRHYEAWSLLRETSRQHLEPFEPSWSADELSWAAFRRRLKRYRRDWKQGTAAPFLIERAEDGVLLGGVTLTNIRHGVTQSASLGYWIGLPYIRRGYAREAVGGALAYAFDRLELNRVEAACMPSNRASIAVLEGAGFCQEGLARRYLKINGVFEDHLLFGRLRQEARRDAENGAGDRDEQRLELDGAADASGGRQIGTGPPSIVAEGHAA
ncbi:MAG: GNAT family protein [Hyphomicrobiaceae bacterium]